MLESLVRILGAVVVVAAAVGLVSVLWPALIGAAWSPTSMGNVRRMLDMASLGPEDVVYDFGSGDGRIVIAAARRHVAKAVGIEADPLRFVWSKLMIRFFGVAGVAKIVRANFFQVSAAEATVVTLFLTQRTNRRLKTKLQGELRNGARVVTYSWTFEGWAPRASDAKSRVYVYVVGEGYGTPQTERTAEVS